MPNGPRCLLPASQDHSLLAASGRGGGTGSPARPGPVSR